MRWPSLRRLAGASGNFRWKPSSRSRTDARPRPRQVAVKHYKIGKRTVGLLLNSGLARLTTQRSKSLKELNRSGVFFETVAPDAVVESLRYGQIISRQAPNDSPPRVALICMRRCCPVIGARPGPLGHRERRNRHWTHHHANRRGDGYRTNALAP